MFGHDYLRIGSAHVEQINAQIARINLNAATNTNNHLKTTMSKPTLQAVSCRTIAEHLVSRV
jgi:hypothetical protein